MITGRTKNSLASVDDVKQLIEFYLAAYHEAEVMPLQRPWYARAWAKLRRGK